MSHEQRTGVPMKGGSEYDALTRFRRFLSFKPGQRKDSKSTYNRRVRRATRNLLKESTCTPPPTST